MTVTVTRRLHDGYCCLRTIAARVRHRKRWPTSAPSPQPRPVLPPNRSLRPVLPSQLQPSPSVHESACQPVAQPGR